MTDLSKNNPTDAEIDQVLQNEEDDTKNVVRPVLLSFSSYARDGTTGYDLFQTAKEISDKGETEIYGDLMKEYENNDFAQFLVHRLAGRLLEFKLIGSEEDKERIQEFFEIYDTMSNLEQALIHAFVYGTGILQRFGDRGFLRNVVRIDTASVLMSKRLNPRTGDIDYVYEQQQETEQENNEANDNFTPEGVVKKKLRTSRLAVFRPRERPDSPYGVSYMRSSLLALQAMRQLNMDIPAAIKRLAYELLVMKVDVSKAKNADEAQTMIKRAIASFWKLDSATNTAIGIDLKNDLKYVGTDGGSQQKLIPILPVIEPILTFLLLKWHVPLGQVLQTNSNRALMVSQVAAAEKELKRLQKKFARFLEREVISYILGNEEGTIPEVRVVHEADLEDQQEELTVFLELYKNGAISRETLLERFGIHESPNASTYTIPSTVTVVKKPEEAGAIQEEQRTLDNDMAQQGMDMQQEKMELDAELKEKQLKEQAKAKAQAAKSKPKV